MKKLRKISNACCLAASLSCEALAEPETTPLLVVTGDFPGHTISADGSVGGELKLQIQTLLSRIDRPTQFLSQPWARAQLSGRTEGLVFPLARTRERENWYHWVGPIGRDRWVFVAGKNNAAAFGFEKDLKDAKFGVTRGSSMHSRLLQKGVGKIQANTRESQNFEMLQKGRIDVWYTTEHILNGMLESRSYQETDVEILRFDDEFAIYVGVSRQLDSSLLNHLQSVALPFPHSLAHNSECPNLQF